MENSAVKFLGDYGEHDGLGVVNGFRKLSELYIRQLVEEGKWFTVCHKINALQEDIMSVTNGQGLKLGSFIRDTFIESSYRSAIYKYMLMNFLCYIEVPKAKFKTDTGRFEDSFNKILATANLGVVADWLGMEVDDLPSKYGSRIYTIDMDDGDDEVPYIELTETKEGVRKARCPKKDIDISERGTRVVPLFMLKAGVDTLYSKMKDSIVKVSFLRDNGRVRELFTTLDFTKVKEIYGGGTFFDNTYIRSYEGVFLENRFLHRGFIRVPEIGGSRYEDDGTRSINYARIISIEYDAEPDLSFINIDLSTVLPEFQEAVQKYAKQSSDIVDMLITFGIDGGAWKSSPGKQARFLNKDMISLLTWSDEQKMVLSTVFLRDLCLFMLSNPQWFGDFTGEPKEGVSYDSSGDVGLG